MNEDTKLILEEIQKLRSDMNERFNAADKRLDTVDEKISVMYEEMTHEFAAVRYEVQTVIDKLDDRINTIETVTAQNYKDIVHLRTKQA